MAEGRSATYEEGRQGLWYEVIALKTEAWDAGEYEIWGEIVEFLFLEYLGSSNEYIQLMIDHWRSLLDNHGRIDD